jgi:hypothetical protein
MDISYHKGVLLIKLEDKYFVGCFKKVGHFIRLSFNFSSDSEWVWEAD